jgi:nicotinamidase/pyrazinamidase
MAMDPGTRTSPAGTSGPLALQAGDALVVVDVQRDFLPGGALGVPEGDRVAPVLNRYIARFRARGLPIVFTRDWHPADHCSFHAQGGPWPPHCVAASEGAAFAPGLDVAADALVVSKATATAPDAYSGFQGTELAGWLRDLGCWRLFIGGLATDYCVLQTVLDALAEGFEVLLLRDAVRAVDVAPGDGARAEQAMIAAGARAIDLDALAEGAT